MIGGLTNPIKASLVTRTGLAGGNRLGAAEHVAVHIAVLLPQVVELPAGYRDLPVPVQVPSGLCLGGEIDSETYC